MSLERIRPCQTPLNTVLGLRGGPQAHAISFPATLACQSMIRRSVDQYLIAPFPWFGGKSKVADIVWRAFGAEVPNYVEPFFGSGAVLLARPAGNVGIETINDLDGYVANFWRAIQHAQDAVAHYADWPVNENDLHARHLWLVARKGDLIAKLQGDPDYYDAKIAGWWVWGICCWIGGGFCSGQGPWVVRDGKMIDAREDGEEGVKLQLPHLGDAGRGERLEWLLEWFGTLSARLRDVRVCSGDWSRVCGPSVTEKNGMTGIFMDPPYSNLAGRAGDIYRVDSESVAHDVREWAIANGNNQLLRIALCGYEGEHTMPDTWACVPWKAHGGYGSQGDGNGRENSAKERIWFSPACLPMERSQQRMFA